jgi:hypothetical protein
VRKEVFALSDEVSTVGEDDRGDSASSSPVHEAATSIVTHMRTRLLPIHRIMPPRPSSVTSKFATPQVCVEG